jgi:hypothetical protein
MIPSLEYGKPIDDMEVVKYRLINFPVELDEAICGPRRISLTVTPTGRLPLPTIIAGALQQGAIAGQVPYPLVAVSRSIKNPTSTNCMILAPNPNNQICAIHSVALNTSL